MPRIETDMKRIILFLIVAAAVPSFSDVFFSEPDLSADNVLLFKATTDAPGYGEYETLFKAELTAGTVTQLTFFPEQLALIDSEEVLQIRNRFGTFRSDRNLDDIGAAGNAPSFSDGGAVDTGRSS